MKSNRKLVVGMFFAATLAVTGIGTGTTWAQDADQNLQPCGNGNVQPSQSEQCDDGGKVSGDGCSDTCQVEPGWVCSGEPSVCVLQGCGDNIVDPNEECDGGGCCNANCTLKSNGETCRESGGACDLEETCDGVSAACPVDAKSSDECRASAGACDVAESCDGVGNDCPADAKSNDECRASAGACDVAESCDGVGNDCPADAKSNDECRASAGACDVAESCDGVGNDCPADAKSNDECRAAAGACDVAESCDGSSDSCPADAFVSSGTECRGSQGICDVVENCDGVSADCPADAKSTDECRGSNGACDVAESCDGVGNDCPADAKASSDTVCRPAINPTCDIEENCDGVSDNCPDDQLLNCGDGDGVECTVSECTVDGCIEEETCVEACRQPAFWQNHSGYEKGVNVGQAVLDEAGPLLVCGQELSNSWAGDLSSILQGLCIRVQGKQNRRLYRQLVTANLNCSISEGGTCEQILNRFGIDLAACDAICTSGGAEQEGGPSLKKCVQDLNCFNTGGRVVDGKCVKGTCSGDSDVSCGDDNDCESGECDEFADSCRKSDLCTEDLEAPAQICPQSGPASSPKACNDARTDGCNIDGCY